MFVLEIGTVPVNSSQMKYARYSQRVQVTTSKLVERWTSFLLLLESICTTQPVGKWNAGNAHDSPGRESWHDYYCLGSHRRITRCSVPTFDRFHDPGGQVGTARFSRRLLLSGLIRKRKRFCCVLAAFLFPVNRDKIAVIHVELESL